MSISVYNSIFGKWVKSHCDSSISSNNLLTYNVCVYIQHVYGDSRKYKIITYLLNKQNNLKILNTQFNVNKETLPGCKYYNSIFIFLQDPVVNILFKFIINNWHKIQAYSSSLFWQINCNTNTVLVTMYCVILSLINLLFLLDRIQFFSIIQ